MSKQQMVNIFGAAKAQAKIDANTLRTQADPDSGLDDEWNREYKIWSDSGAEIEKDRRKERVNNDQLLELEGAKKASEALLSAGLCMANLDVDGGTAASSSDAPKPPQVKLEPMEKFPTPGVLRQAQV